MYLNFMLNNKLNNIFHKTNKCFQLFESRENLLYDLDRLAKRIKVPAMIIGGAALPKYNYNRVTEDIDIVTTVDDAYKLGDELGKLDSFRFIGHSKFQHNSGISINFCPEGVNAGRHKFPAPELSKPGLSYVSLPRLLSMKIQSKRLKDRGDYAELIKRNNLDWNYIKSNIFPLLKGMDKQWARVLFKKAKNEG